MADLDARLAGAVTRKSNERDADEFDRMLDVLAKRADGYSEDVLRRQSERQAWAIVARQVRSARPRTRDMMTAQRRAETKW